MPLISQFYLHITHFSKTMQQNLNTISITVQRDATQSSLFIILQVHCTCFGCQPHPSSGAHKTVTTASGTGHVLLCSYLPPMWPSWPCQREVAAQYWRLQLQFCVLLMMDVVDTQNMYSELARIINKLLCVAPHWTIINTDRRWTEP